MKKTYHLLVFIALASSYQLQSKIYQEEVIAPCAAYYTAQGKLKKTCEANAQTGSPCMSEKDVRRANESRPEKFDKDLRDFPS